MSRAVGLPDLHPGKGSPIDAAFAVEGLLCLPLVGNDIGCGMALWTTDRPAHRFNRGPLVIPGSRGELSYLVEPEGDGRLNLWSLAHGAGRKW